MPPYEVKESFEKVIRIEGFDIDLSEFAVSREEVDHLHKRFLNHLEEDGVREEYEEADLHWLLHSRSYQIERFVMSANLTKVDGLQLIQRCLLWRKQIGLSSMTDESFPLEFYQKGGLFRYKEDAQGTPLLYMRIKMIKKYPELDQLLKRFLAYQVSKIDNSCNRLMGWAVVFDCSEIGFANVQIDMMRFLISILKDYFPAGVRYVLVYDLPWILSAVQRMIFTWIPDESKKQIFFKTRKNIQKMIPKANLPDYMGGGCSWNYKQAPAKCLPFRQMFAQDYSPEEMDRIQQILDNIN